MVCNALALTLTLTLPAAQLRAPLAHPLQPQRQDKAQCMEGDILTVVLPFICIRTRTCTCIGTTRQHPISPPPPTFLSATSRRRYPRALGLTKSATRRPKRVLQVRASTRFAGEMQAEKRSKAEEDDDIRVRWRQRKVTASERGEKTNKEAKRDDNLIIQYASDRYATGFGAPPPVILTQIEPSDAELAVKCDRCPYRGPQSTFPQKKNLTYNKSCFACKKKQAEERAEKRASKNDANDTDEATRGTRRAPPIQPTEGYTTLEWQECAALLDTHKNDAFELETFVSVLGESAKAAFDGLESGKDVADKMAQLVWNITGYRFIYKKSKKSSASDSVQTYTYYCAQNEDEVKKPQLHDEPQMHRARMKMSRFPCKGTLQITVDNNNLELPLRLKLKHHQSHIHYVDISINKNIRDLVEGMKHDSATNIWTRVLAQNPGTEVTQKQIYALWSELNEGEWRLDDDQVKSAQMILQKMEGTEVEFIPIRSEPGIHSIAFAFKEVLDGWAKENEELAMDLTWRTNAAQYELYAFVGEANGQAMPFVFLFTVSTGDAAEGAKTRMLGDVLKYMNKRCPDIMFTLSDKEPAEISACRTEIPKAKHQLCYWHAITYIQERLAENKPPAAYDPRKAHQIFDFINPTWAPGVTAVYADEDEEGDGMDEAAEPGTQMPKPSQTCIPPVFILKTGDVRIPVWPNPPKITKKALPEFCPKEFRSDIIEMYRTHLHQHPKIPRNNPDEPYLSAKEIHCRAVRQVYNFCYSNGLSQVWAYLWNRWYTPNQWSLWTRASCDAIPRLKTTMVVESLWRHVKHRDLAQFNRPQLDLVVNIVFKSLLPRVKRTLEYVGKRMPRRSGSTRAVQTSTAESQRELQLLKSAPNTKGRAERLQQLAEEGREAGTYTTDIEKWVCSCEYFFKSRFLMCKHLIREANKRLDNKPLADLRFFLDLRRNHFPPYYTIPGIHTSAHTDSDEDPQPKEVLVLGIRGAVAPSREERPEIAREPASVDGCQDQTSASAPTDRESVQNDSREETDGVRIDDAQERSDDEEEVSDRDNRVKFSEGRVIHLKRCWEDMMGVINNPRGVHPKMAAVLEGAFAKIENIGGDIGRDKRRRKNPRTWDDNNANIMYLD
ncbi:SWIM-type domain-containing protein [Mycena venus]|uniref:SWIM-type domain-containing protein n=1 Tax=Mycena venus TaxID=2733690 RepID=A0A8H7CRN0_9AGAR|nr:SWIM-type domain-containing protein [Mycena venus]